MAVLGSLLQYSAAILRCHFPSLIFFFAVKTYFDFYYIAHNLHYALSLLQGRS